MKRYRVIINRVVIQGLTRKQVLECFCGVQREALEIALKTMESEKIIGFSFQHHCTDVQLDKYEV